MLDYNRGMSESPFRDPESAEAAKVPITPPLLSAAQRKALDGVFTGCIDALATCKGDLEAVLGAAKKEEAEWDPDA